VTITEIGASACAMFLGFVIEQVGESLGYRRGYREGHTRATAYCMRLHRAADRAEAAGEKSTDGGKP
jgi:hypothetical protein